MESVLFKEPSLLVGKTIEFAVHNTLQNSDIYQNNFFIKIMNAHAEKLYPDGEERESWMTCKNETGNTSVVGTYTFVEADINKGINGMSNSF